MPFDQPAAGPTPPAMPPPLQPGQSGQPLETTLVARPQVTAGSLASRTMSVWWQNLWRFTGLMLLALVPLVVVGIGAAILIPSLVNRGARFEDSAPLVFGLVALVAVVALPLAAILLGGLSYGVVQHLAGRRVGIGAMLSQGGRRVWPLTAAILLVMLAILGGYILLIVPGIMIAIATSVALPAVAVEGLGATAAFRRSLELTRGYRWSIFGGLFLVGLVQFGLNMVSQLTTLIHPLLAAILVFVVVLPASVLSWILPAVAYHDLRVAKEGVDTSALAKVFE